MTRHGFTLTELIIGIVVMAIVGVGLTRILISNSRFVSRQDAMMEARGTSRAALQAMVTELHMVADSGLQAATRDSVTVRVPYTFGTACRTSGGTTVASMMPTDSLMNASAVVGGMAWRDVLTGTYRSAITGIAVAPSANTAACTADSIRVIPGGRLIGISGIPGPNTPPSGSLFYLYQTVTYKFATSVDVPARRGLWRQAGAAAYEELAAPFDTSARFSFLLGPFMRLDTRTSVGSQVARDSVRGLQLRLTGQSINPPQGDPRPYTFDLRTSVAFMNKLY
jgi:prepilin-type N-terminal cleavage/methylation domain-containing protein